MGGYYSNPICPRDSRGSRAKPVAEVAEFPRCRKSRQRARLKHRRCRGAMSVALRPEESVMAIDQKKLEEFLGKVVGDVGAAMSAALVIVGDRLGLYKAMASGEPITASELAKKTETVGALHPRMARCAGVGRIRRRTTRRSARYSLAARASRGARRREQPRVRPRALPSHAGDVERRAQESSRTSAPVDGLEWGRQHPCLFEGTERFFRAGYVGNLIVVVVAGARRRRGEARGGREGRRRRLRARRVDHSHGEGVPEVDVLRIRLPPRIDRPRERAREATPASRIASSSPSRNRRISRAPATISSPTSIACTISKIPSAPRSACAR